MRYRALEEKAIGIRADAREEEGVKVKEEETGRREKGVEDGGGGRGRREDRGRGEGGKKE